MTRIKVVIFIAICISSTLEAQTFRAGIVAGLNAAQIDGDELAGYNKFGLRLGVGALFDIHQNWEAGMQLLLSERGSRSSNTDLSTGRIRLQYAEIPLQIAYKDWWFDDSYYKVRFLLGLSVGRLIESSVDDGTTSFPVDDFATTDYTFMAGAQFYSSEKMLFGLNYNRSMNPLFKSELSNSRLVGYFISLYAMRLL